MKRAILLIEIVIVTILVSISGCTQTEQLKKENNKNTGEEYRWSTMNEGPYRDKISFATSTDLFHWTDSQQILAEHASVPGAIYKNGTIHVYFVDVSEDGKPEQLGLIRSDDNGLTWSPKELVSVEDVGDKVPVDPAPFLLQDGGIRLYYFDINEQRISSSPTGTNKIYSAISTDGLHFIQETGIRFERQGIFDPDVIKENETWRMYVGDINSNKVISAVSSDGLAFAEEGVAYEGGAVPDVLYSNGTYYLYTAGIDISTSTDGAHFTKTSYFFRSGLGMVTADPSIIQLSNGTYMMLYKTKE